MTRSLLSFLILFTTLSATASPSFRISTFKADITAPLGHALMGGGIHPASEVIDPLFAKGICLQQEGEQPIVFLSLDWCEVRNDAYDHWREALAKVAETSRDRVLLACIHQHDTPVADLNAQRLLDDQGLDRSLIDVNFFEESVRKTCEALRDSLPNAQHATHYGIGQATVESVASNRRVAFRNGKVAFPRNSATTDPEVIAAPVDTIDPLLKTLSFWSGDRPLVAMSFYAVHPMSYYGKGGITYDFVGMAREKREAETPGTFQVYFSGCSGDVTAGKYNTGAKENRPALADRMYRAMKAAWDNTQRFPLEKAEFHRADLRVPPRDDSEYTLEAMESQLADKSLPTFKRNLAAMGLSWRKRSDRGQPIDLALVDFGRAAFLLMPAESFVQYQLDAQDLAPDRFMVVAGYGESAPGYIPSASAVEELFIETHDWCWVSREAPEAMHAALQAVLKGMD